MVKNLESLQNEAKKIRNEYKEGGQLTLTELDVSNNQLKKLPPELGQLSSLEVLWVNYNQFDKLPTEAGQLTSLRILSIRIIRKNLLFPLNLGA